MSEKKNSNNFIAQAGILAIAGIITRIIGLLYRSPLHGVIHDVGLGYYSEAYTYYTLILMISSYSIPSAVSKVIAQKLAFREYRNAHRMFYGALFYVCVIGAVASLFLYFGAGLFVSKEAIPVLRVFAPTIFIYGILGVLRGYFQAHKTMVQTSVSQIFEQIANAVVSVLAAYLFIKTFMGTMEMPPEESTEYVDRAVYGAMGSALGTGVGVTVGLIVMLLVYALNRKIIHRRINRDTHENIDSVGYIIKTITLVVTPFILSTAICNLSDMVGTKLFKSWYPYVRNLDSVKLTADWGIFAGQARTIANIPIAFASAMAAAMLPLVSQLIAAKDYEASKEKIGTAVKTTMLISIPSAVGLFVLAKPVTSLLFVNKEAAMDMAGKSLMALSLSVIFYALSTLNSNILQAIGKLNTPIINAGIALIVQTLTAGVLLYYTDLGVYSIAIANTVYSGMMAFMNQWAVKRALGYRQEYRKTFIIPFVASAFMGAVAWAVYQLCYMLTNSMRISAIPAIVLAVLTYFVFLFILRGLTAEDLASIPKGNTIAKMARKMHLLK